MIVQTHNTRYIVVDTGDGGILISGDAARCPRPTQAQLLEPIVVGRRMNYRPMEGEWPKSHSSTAFVSTSPVVSVDDVG